MSIIKIEAQDGVPPPDAVSHQKTKLHLELIRTEPLPVIDASNLDAKDILGGFEAGSTVKLSIDGITRYHMISTTMETVGWERMRTEHWVSEDGFEWRRKNVLVHPHFDSETGLWILTGSPFPFYDSMDNRWYVYFNYMAFNGVKAWHTPCLLRRAGAKATGLAGINGEFEFPGEIVASPGIAYPTDCNSSYISSPFKAADDQWYAFLGGDNPLNSESGKWWTSIVKATGPGGPFIYQPEYSPVPFMDPTGYVENALPMKFKGSKTGKDYWAIIFNYLKNEVTTGSNSEIGFSSSPDGLKWPAADTQLLDLSKGLPAEANPWWRCIRVPHQLVDEGNGTYTCFFSAYHKVGNFEGIGRATFRVAEEVLP
ncbi:MAG: hypothetical protein LV481_09275 [Methylacidiphilales bacterium]|nr:hypothetical protein [Candidatus Methylacidiphilales bacterium]